VQLSFPDFVGEFPVAQASSLPIFHPFYKTKHQNQNKIPM